MSELSSNDLLTAARDLIQEAYRGPANPKYTWFADNEPDSGLLGSIQWLSAEEASHVPFPGGDSIAGHCKHVTYYLSLANREFRGQEAFSKADWSGSWKVGEVDASKWQYLVRDLEQELELTLELLEGPIPVDDPNVLKGVLALLAHGAWHLGAVRQLVGVVKERG